MVASLAMYIANAKYQDPFGNAAQVGLPGSWNSLKDGDAHLIFVFSHIIKCNKTKIKAVPEKQSEALKKWETAHDPIDWPGHEAKRECSETHINIDMSLARRVQQVCENRIVAV